VTLRAKAEVEKPLTDALRALQPSLSLADKKEVARVMRATAGGGDNGGGNSGGGGRPDEIG
jgi:hypothetical protein